MKLLYTFVFVLLTSLVYGQKSILHQNVNVRAKELKHNLNQTGDSIVFNCERTIYEVVIFNDDFERIFKVKDSKAKIPVADVPVGKYIVEALLSDKLIVITLLRNEPFELRESTPMITDTSDLFGKKLTPQKEILASTEKIIEVPKKAVEKKVAVVTKKMPLPKKESFDNEKSLSKTNLALSGKKAKRPKKKVVVQNNTSRKSNLSLFNKKTVETKKAPKPLKREVNLARANRISSMYWIVYKINTGNSSRKILKMGDRETVDRMIRKIEVDMKTRAGRFNELSVWTVYDTDKFVQHKRMNKNNYINIASESFNIVPYYKKEHNSNNI